MILGVPFELVQGHQALSRVDGEISVFGIVAWPTRFPVEFQCETSLLLRCNGNIGIPFQTMQGNPPPISRWGGAKGLRLRCVGKLGVTLKWRQDCWGTSEFHKGCRVPYRVSRGNVWFLARCCSGKEPHLTLRGESRGFHRGLVGSLGSLSSCDVGLKILLILLHGSQVSFWVVTGTSGFLPSHCRVNIPQIDLCPETPCSSPVGTGISRLPSMFPWGVGSRLELKQRTLLSSCNGYLLGPFKWP